MKSCRELKESAVERSILSNFVIAETLVKYYCSSFTVNHKTATPKT